MTRRLKRSLKDLVNKILGKFRYTIMPNALLYDWQADHQAEPSHNIHSSLPAGALDYLCTDNPRFEELQKRYSVFNRLVTKPLIWVDGLVKNEDILYFRGDNAYVWQLRGPNCNIMS